MNKTLLHIALTACACFSLLAQSSDSSGAVERTEVTVGRVRPQVEGTQIFGHPFEVVAKHPKAGCDDTAVCGEEFYRDHGHNLRTSAGTTWQGQLMTYTSTPAVNLQANYIGLSTSAVTPAEADTSLSGETTANGIACAGVRCQGTYAALSGALTVPAAPTPTVVGTTGSTTYYYWVASCNQGICTTPSATSGSTTTANATLSTTNYVSVAFTGQAGAATYQLYRTTANTIPSGSPTDLVGGNPACSTVGTVVSCTWNDVSNTLTSVTIPGSNLTNFGEVTLTKTWTATGTVTGLQAFGIFTASSSTTMCFEGTFASVSLNTNDTFQLVESIFY